MFEITSDDIELLNDKDLRTLIGLLCEAELDVARHPRSAVTWGGDQDAPDGGIDVRVSLPPGETIKGFVPRAQTGFQVKVPAMTAGAIAKEMRPNGRLRPAIRDLARSGGSYVIVSGRANASDTTLPERIAAMRAAVHDEPSGDRLQLDFYDRNRVATWVRGHPGLVLWVHEHIGKAPTGWSAYGAWARAADSIAAPYLYDDTPRIRFGDVEPVPTLQGIDKLRAVLAQPGTITRLVGLSGLGKTRLAQALFDERIGVRPLPASWAVYTDLNHGPFPQPVAMGSELRAQRHRAVMIVDNCSSDAHRGLAVAFAKDPYISVLTIEYDVRDELPEDTTVISLEPASGALIEELLLRRFEGLSRAAVSRVADLAGGNSRLAIALASKLDKNEEIAGISDSQLFDRLFDQRNGKDPDLLQAAQTLALVYSFDSETLDGDDAELPRLATLSDLPLPRLRRHVATLMERDLVQRRAQWRAVLPHALANHLATQALTHIPISIIRSEFERPPFRLLRSFSRRLSYLHTNPLVQSLVKEWFAAGGLLSNPLQLPPIGRDIYCNVALIAPREALEALGRTVSDDSILALEVISMYTDVLRGAAYDAHNFHRAAEFLAMVAVRRTNMGGTGDGWEAFTSLFRMQRSGTHASLEQRLEIVAELIASPEEIRQELGLGALEAAIASGYSYRRFVSILAQLSDWGYEAKTKPQIEQWYTATLAFLLRAASQHPHLKPAIGAMLAKQFPGMWRLLPWMRPSLADVIVQFADGRFWAQGWAASRIVKQDRRGNVSAADLERIDRLERDLAPTDLVSEIEALVLFDSTPFDFDPHDSVEAYDQIARQKDQHATKLGATVAIDGQLLQQLLPRLVRQGHRIRPFGEGLGQATTDVRATWSDIVTEYLRADPKGRSLDLLDGYLLGASRQHEEQVQQLLDEVCKTPDLVHALPHLQNTNGLNDRGVARLTEALISGGVGPKSVVHLGWKAAAQALAPEGLENFVFALASIEGGFVAAIEILYSCMFVTARETSAAFTLQEIGRKLLLQMQIRHLDVMACHALCEVIRDSLSGRDSAAQVTLITQRYLLDKRAALDGPTEYQRVATALLETDAKAVLDTLFPRELPASSRGLFVFHDWGDGTPGPAAAIPVQTLINWCDADAGARYEIAASFVDFAIRPNENGPLAWTERALALFANAPEPVVVLQALVDRFAGVSGSGSAAERVEENAKLLDLIPHSVGNRLASTIQKAKADLGGVIAQIRRDEFADDQRRNEKFE